MIYYTCYYSLNLPNCRQVLPKQPEEPLVDPRTQWKESSLIARFQHGSVHLETSFVGSLPSVRKRCTSPSPRRNES